jgi:hypothetical protein
MYLFLMGSAMPEKCSFEIGLRDTAFNDRQKLYMMFNNWSLLFSKKYVEKDCKRFSQVDDVHH